MLKIKNKLQRLLHDRWLYVPLYWDRLLICCASTQINSRAVQSGSVDLSFLLCATEPEISRWTTLFISQCTTSILHTRTQYTTFSFISLRNRHFVSIPCCCHAKKKIAFCANPSSVHYCRCNSWSKSAAHTSFLSSACNERRRGFGPYRDQGDIFSKLARGFSCLPFLVVPSFSRQEQKLGFIEFHVQE